MIRHRSTRGLASAGALVVALPLLGGCATQDGLGSLLNTSGDACYEHRALLQDQESAIESATLDNALKSVAIGAAAGVVTWLITGDAGTGAAVGAGVGLASFVYQQADLQARTQYLNAGWNSADKTNAAADRAQLSLDRLMDCRRDQARTVQAELRTGKITRDEAAKRMGVIRAAYQEDLRIAREVNASLKARVAELEGAAGKVDPNGVRRVSGFSPYAATTRSAGEARRNPNVDAAVAGQVRPGQAVRVTSRRADWVQIAGPSGTIGWVKENTLIRESAPARFVAQGSEPIRAAPDRETAEVGRVGQGQTRTVTAKMPGWVAIDLGSQTRGFVSDSAMQPAAGAQASLRGDEDAVLRATATSTRKRDAFDQQVAQAASSANEFTL